MSFGAGARKAKGVAAFGGGPHVLMGGVTPNAATTEAVPRLQMAWPSMSVERGRGLGQSPKKNDSFKSIYHFPKLRTNKEDLKTFPPLLNLS